MDGELRDDICEDIERASEEIADALLYVAVAVVVGCAMIAVAIFIMA